MKVIVTSFKPSGKYYTTGEYETTREHIFQIFDEVEERALAGEYVKPIDGQSVLVRRKDRKIIKSPSFNPPNLLPIIEAQMKG